MNRTAVSISSLMVLALTSAAAGQSANAGSHPGGNSPGANPPGHSAANPPAPNPHSPNPNASPNAAAVQAVLQKFDAARDQYVSQRTTLVNQLAAATTDADRQKILDELRAQQQTLQAEQRATAKEIRHELETLRRQRGGG